jgi:hypothetical protein
MKLLILPLILFGAGASWFGLAPADDTPAASDVCQDEGCRATVECTPDGTCVVVCYDADGVERCRQEVPCDRECDRPCDAPRDCAEQSDCSARPCAR